MSLHSVFSWIAYAFAPGNLAAIELHSCWDGLYIIARLTAPPRSSNLLRPILINKNRYSHRLPHAGRESSQKCNGQGDQTFAVPFKLATTYLVDLDLHSHAVPPGPSLLQSRSGCSLVRRAKDLPFWFVDPPPPPLPSMAQFGVQPHRALLFSFHAKNFKFSFSDQPPPKVDDSSFVAWRDGLFLIFNYLAGL